MKENGYYSKTQGEDEIGEGTVRTVVKGNNSWWCY